MESAKLSVVHFNSEDVIATSGTCTALHTEKQIMKVTELVGLYTVKIDNFYDNGKEEDINPDDNIFTFCDNTSIETGNFDFTPEVGDIFYKGVDLIMHKCDTYHELYYPQQ